MQPEEALKAALDFEGKPVFITDSGDNVTSGAGGWNTFVLKQVLNISNLSKSFLFATICDPNTYHLLENKEIGEQVHITLGVGYDELSSPVELDITIKSKGKLVGFMMHDHNEVFGETVNVTINNTKIDIMIASTSWAVCEKQQFIKAGIDWDAYDVIVVKEGYIFPELKAKGKLSIMSLTQGATLQDTALYHLNVLCVQCIQKIIFKGHKPMMNILVGKFVLEANENVPKLCDLENVELKFGKDIYDVLQLGDYINDKALNLIPSISANANSSGVMKKVLSNILRKDC